MFQIDVNNVFLNGFLEGIVYMVQPLSFEVKDKTLVCKLNKAICGLKQATRQWFHRQQTLHQLGIISHTYDSSLFVYRKQLQVVYSLVYVDNIVIASNSPELIHSITSNSMLLSL